jgi:hypothetical protein
VTRAEDMRYEIRVMADDSGRLVPWLLQDTGVCNLDCASDANVSGAHRSGCGLEPLVPVHKLRVAYQQKQRRDAQTAKGNALIGDARDGVLVKAMRGDRRNEVVFEGRAVAFADFPTVVIERPDGSRRFWSIDLVERLAGDHTLVFPEPVPLGREVRYEMNAPAGEVWDGSTAPGGWVCVYPGCGAPVESEPCPTHGHAIEHAVQPAAEKEVDRGE